MRKSSTLSAQVHGSLLLNMLLKQNVCLDQLSPMGLRVQSSNHDEKGTKASYSQLHSEKASHESMHTRQGACLGFKGQPQTARQLQRNSSFS